MYHHPGEYVTDFCVVRREGLYHLFHIRGERWTWPLGYREIDLGHAVSSDMCAWTPLPPVLEPGGPGAWDETGIWAPDIIELDGTYYMFYTGSDATNNQSIGCATSNDLHTWQPHHQNPVVTPGQWSDRAVGQDVACRDGMVFADTERSRFLMYYTATMADGRACIALAQSDNMYDWEDLGPTYIEQDRSFNRCESPYLVQHNDTYYLFYSAKGGPKSKGFRPDQFAHFDICYLMSSDPTSGWVRPSNHILIEGRACASEHPTFDGQTYMLYIIQEELEGIWGASVLSDPKRIEWLPDGTVQVREQLPESASTQQLFAQEAGFSDWIGHGGRWRADSDELHAPGIATDAYLMHTLWGDDIACDTEILAEPGAVASLLVRANPSALAGYRVSLDVERSSVALLVKIPGLPDRLVQERPVSLAPGQWHRVRAVIQGPFIEVYVDEGLVIVYDLHTYSEGCFGLHAQGQVRFRETIATTAPRLANQLAAPWTRRCLPRHLQT